MTKSTGLRMHGVRSKALATGSVRYFTGIACKYGHVAERLTSNGVCVVCAVRISTKSQKKYPEKTKAAHNLLQQKYARTKPELGRKRKASYRERHPDKIRAGSAIYYDNNREKFGARKDAWIKANPSARAEWERTRQARKRRAMPIWADRAAIKKIYKESELKTRETGVKHSVDHFYPLCGKTVSGLHVEFNLRVIPLTENVKKNRRMPSDSATV